MGHVAYNSQVVSLLVGKHFTPSATYPVVACMPYQQQAVQVEPRRGQGVFEAACYNNADRYQHAPANNAQPSVSLQAGDKKATMGMPAFRTTAY